MYSCFCVLYCYCSITAAWHHWMGLRLTWGTRHQEPPAHRGPTPLPTMTAFKTHSLVSPISYKHTNSHTKQYPKGTDYAKFIEDLRQISLNGDRHKFPEIVTFILFCSECMWALHWTPGSCLCEGHCTAPFTFLTVRHTTGGHCQVRECLWMPVYAFLLYVCSDTHFLID